MNILPKKRWHVRTRENITRVRRDEAAAAEEERKRLLKTELAEKEARNAFLKTRARELYGKPPTERDDIEEPNVSSSSGAEIPGHVNLFYELNEKSDVSNKTNLEHDKEVKEEREKYEKQIGYLTYLGQDTNELTGNVSWYNKERKRQDEDNTEVDLKAKNRDDPLHLIKKGAAAAAARQSAEHEALINKVLLNKLEKQIKESSRQKKKKKTKKKKKEKKHKSSSASKEEKNTGGSSHLRPELIKLREERLRRERKERARAEEVLARLQKDDDGSAIDPKLKQKSPSPEIVQKYNSQFNPHLARQNYA